MTETKTPREFWIHPEFDNKSWEFTAFANKPIHHDFYIHVVEMSALTECREELRLARQNVDGQRRVNDRQYAEKLDLEEKLELQTKNCISLFLHESRVADLEAKLKASEAEWQRIVDLKEVVIDKYLNDAFVDQANLRAANELIAELKEFSKAIEGKDIFIGFRIATRELTKMMLDKIKIYEDKK